MLYILAKIKYIKSIPVRNLRVKHHQQKKATKCRFFCCVMRRFVNLQASGSEARQMLQIK